MKLLILGASGQLGSSLLKSNLDRYEVHAPSSSSVDVTDFENTKKYILELRPDFIINATAWTNVPGAEENAEGAFALNEAAVSQLAYICKEIESCLIHVSTDHVFDGLKSSDYLEEDSTAPLNNYGASKLAGENAIVESGLKEFYIVRTSWLYSRFGKNFVKTIATKSLKGESASITNDQFGSPTFSGDLAGGLLSLLDKKAEPGIYNYSNSGVTSWYEFGRMIYELMGTDQALVTPRETEISELKRPKYSPLNLSKWESAGLSRTRSWRVALAAELPEIVDEIKKLEN